MTPDIPSEVRLNVPIENYELERKVLSSSEIVRLPFPIPMVYTLAERFFPKHGYSLKGTLGEWFVNRELYDLRIMPFPDNGLLENAPFLCWARLCQEESSQEESSFCLLTRKEIIDAYLDRISGNRDDLLFTLRVSDLLSIYPIYGLELSFNYLEDLGKAFLEFFGEDGLLEKMVERNSSARTFQDRGDGEIIFYFPLSEDEMKDAIPIMSDS